MSFRLPVAVAAALAVACSFDASGVGGGDAGGEPPDAAVAAEDGDLGGACERDGDCEGGVCDEGSNRCVECTGDGDCGPGRVCEDDACVEVGTIAVCGGETVDLDTDADHCGACFNACGDGTTGTCVGGHCESRRTCNDAREGQFGGGEGTSDDPFLICRADQLGLLSGSDDSELLSSHFLVTRDVDLDGFDGLDGDAWQPIGDGDPFEGHFDGNHYGISNFTIDLSSDGSGFFGRIAEDGEVRNAILEGLDGEGDGGDDVGLLAGRNDGLIENASARGAIEGDKRVGGLVGRNGGEIRAALADVAARGSEDVGGLVGSCEGGTIAFATARGAVGGEQRVGGLVGIADDCLITDSRAEGEVTARGRRVGGLVGKLDDDAGVRRSAATGAVILDGDDDAAGGLVGRMNEEGTYISESFATGDVSAAEADEVGGLVGLLRREGAVTDSYATGRVEGDDEVGGLIGRVERSGAVIERNYAIGIVVGDDDVGGLIGKNDDDDNVVASYWWLDEGENDEQVGESAGGESLDTEQFGEVVRFVGWEFDDVWRMEGGQGPPVDRRPVLNWQGER